MLEPDEIYFSTTRSCDCGTSLGALNQDVVDGLDRQKAKWIKRNGWSEQQAEDWYQGKINEISRHDERSDPGGWCGIIDDLKREAGLSHIGTMLHWYSRDVEKERINVIRTGVPRTADIRKILWCMREDELIVIA